MATQVPPLRGTTFTYEIALVSQADSAIFQVNPTLAAGDVIIYKDGALDGNADNLPTAIGGSAVVTHTLSVAEMTADRITVKFTDVAGAEWQDALVNIFTVTSNQIDDLATEAELTAGLAGLNDPSAATISDAVWDELSAGHIDAGKAGQQMWTDVDAILVDTNELQTDDIPGQIAALNNISTAEVNAEVLDVLNVDTFAEPGQAAPPATTTLVQKIGYLYKAFRNKITQTSTTLSLYNDAGAVVDQKATVSDNGTTYTRGKIGTGP